jgi:hypothetical protein
MKEKPEQKSSAVSKKQKKLPATESEINYAEMLYCEKGISPQAISEELERDIKTIYAWRDKYKWDNTKELFTTSPNRLKKILLNEAMRIAKGEKRLDDSGNEIKGSDADSLSKIMKAYDYMNSKLSPEVIRDVLMKRDVFIASIEPKRAVEDTKYNKMFLQEILSEWQ